MYFLKLKNRTIYDIKKNMVNLLNNTLVENINIKYSEMDFDFSLKPYSLLNFLQDIASKSAEELGFGYSAMSPKNLSWFLIKYRMEFDNYPVNLQEITLNTTPRGYNKLFAFRNFEMYNGEERLGRITSMWSIVDMTTRKTVPVPTVIENNPNMPAFERNESDLAFNKIRPIENPTITKEFEVRYNDLDVNGHANNGNYIVWALEPLPYEFRSTHKIKTIDMIYKKEARYGEPIISELEITNNTTIHRLKNQQNEDLCLIECSWE